MKPTVLVLLLVLAPSVQASPFTLGGPTTTEPDPEFVLELPFSLTIAASHTHLAPTATVGLGLSLRGVELGDLRVDLVAAYGFGESETLSVYDPVTQVAVRQHALDLALRFALREWLTVGFTTRGTLHDESFEGGARTLWGLAFGPRVDAWVSSGPLSLGLGYQLLLVIAPRTDRARIADEHLLTLTLGVQLF